MNEIRGEPSSGSFWGPNKPLPGQSRQSLAEKRKAAHEVQARVAQSKLRAQQQKGIMFTKYVEI